MAGYIGKSQGVTQVDGYTRAESDAIDASTQTFNRTGSDGTIVTLQKDGSTVGSIGSRSGVYTYMGSQSSGLIYTASDNKIVPYNTSTLAYADNSIDLGDSGARFKNLFLSGGVYLGGTGSANHLDDYEEGTWTPVLQSADGCFSSVTSISSVSGYYIKVGSQVTVWYKLTPNQSITNDEGILRLDGLPFNSGTSNYGAGGAQIYGNHGSNNSEAATSGITGATVYVYRGTVNGTTGTPQIHGFAIYLV